MENTQGFFQLSKETREFSRILLIPFQVHSSQDEIADSTTGTSLLMNGGTYILKISFGKRLGEDQRMQPLTVLPEDLPEEDPYPFD